MAPDRTSLTAAFRSDQNGNVAMLFGLAIVPILGVVGGAVDYSVASNKKLELQVALDAAAMLAAKGPPQTAQALRTAIEQSMTRQLAGSMIKPTEWQLVTAQDVDGRVTASARANFKTQFLSIMNVAEVTVAAATEVARAQTKLEVALVLDNTGSMATNNKIGTLRTSATTLIDTLYAGANSGEMVKAALIPFVTAVNIKADTGFDMAWIDTDAKAKYHGINFNPNPNGSRANHLTLFNALGTPWRGCVEARAEPYDTEDTPPNPAVPDTLFVPWFWPDEPDSGISYTGGTDYQNNYMPDDYTKPNGVNNSATAAARQRNTTKYTTKKSQKQVDEVPSATSGPNKACPDPLTPLTNNAALMRTRIGAMMPWNNSGTNIAQGMVWGWSVLSPEPPFTDGVAYDDKKTQKAMIVLTDGENEVFGGWSTHNKSDYSGYNYLAVNRLGTTSKTAGVDAVNEKVKTLCAKIKAKGIRLYTITFQLGSATTQQMFRDCATTPELYYNSPSSAELKGIFQTIAADLGNLRFSK